MLELGSCKVATPPAKTGNFNKAKSGKAISERRQAGKGEFGQPVSQPTSQSKARASVGVALSSNVLDAGRAAARGVRPRPGTMGRWAVAMMTEGWTESSNSRRRHGQAK